MIELLAVQMEYLFRIILAGVCGGFVGYERKSRGKEAGIRTHMVVALASALMMIVSKYGFTDIAGGADPSRVASTIITGVGFLGAGMIYFQNRNIRGLTTAAGVWAISGIGMAIGAGMYIIGTTTAIILVVAQIFLHRNLRIMQTMIEEELYFTIENNDEAVNTIKEVIAAHDIQVEKIKCKKSENNMLNLEMIVNVPQSFDPQLLLDIVKDYPFVEMASV